MQSNELFKLDFYMTIGHNISMSGEELKKWREQWSITQAELARLLGTYQETISRWERGVRGIPSHLALALEALEHRLRKEEKGNGMHQ
jgi:DNA-binding transcriptional regulator YiaG